MTLQECFSIMLLLLSYFHQKILKFDIKYADITGDIFFSSQ